MPVIAEETCFVFVRDILKGLAFLNSKGLEHGDIKGNSLAAGDDYWLTDSFFVYFQLDMSLPDFSGNESHAWSLSPSENGFQKFQAILSSLRNLTCYIQTLRN